MLMNQSDLIPMYAPKCPFQMMVMQNGDGPGKELAALQDVKDGERFVRCVNQRFACSLPGAPSHP